MTIVGILAGDNFDIIKSGDCVGHVCGTVLVLHSFTSAQQSIISPELCKSPRLVRFTTQCHGCIFM